MADEFIELLRRRQAFADCAVGISIIDPAGRFLLVNRTYCRLTGYTKQELAARDYQSITHPDDVAANRRRLRRLFAGEIRDTVYEKRYIRKSGDVIWVRNSVSMMRDERGNPERAIKLTEDISGCKRAEESTHAVKRRMRQIAAALLRAEDMERRRIARELHDGTGQLLACVAMNLCRLRNPDLDAAQRDELLAEALDWVRQCSGEIRTLFYLLHPPSLAEVGLVRALEIYAEGFEQHSGIVLKLRVSSHFGRLDPETEATIFRIVQEGLTNILRHSDSRRAAIALRHNASEVRVEMLDFGGGLAAAFPGHGKSPAHAGVAILGMRERAELLGGRLDITSDHRGTRIAVVLPRAG